MKFDRVNWSDGMLIKKDHFNQLTNYFESKNNLLYSQVYGDSLNFGLIKVSDDFPSLELRIIDDKIKLEYLSGLFKNGQFIAYENKQFEVSFNLSEIKPSSNIEIDFIVFATLIENEFVNYGEPDSFEFPPRMPWKNNLIKLTCLPLNEYKSRNQFNNYLAIGYLKYSIGVFSLLNNYIPPCLHVNGHSLLYSKYKQYYDDLYNLYLNTLACSQIARSSKKPGETNDLAQSLQFISERLTDFISDHIDSYNIKGSLLPTWEWYLIYKRMARNVFNSFACLRNMDSQEVKQSLHAWTGVMPNELTEAIQTVLDDQYEQSLIHTNIAKIDQLMNVFIKLFKKLKEYPVFRYKKDSLYEATNNSNQINEEPKPNYKSPYSL